MRVLYKRGALKVFKVIMDAGYLDGVAPDPTFAYDFAKEWLNRPRKRNEDYDMFGSAMAAEMKIPEWKNAKKDPVGDASRGQVAWLAQLFLHPQDNPLTFEIDDLACKDGFLHMMKRPNKGTIVDALISQSVPYAFVGVQGHISICSYDAEKKRLVFMNSLNIRELDKVNFLKVCEKQDQGPAEYCVMTLGEFAGTKWGRNTPADVQRAEAMFMTIGNCRSSTDDFWPRRKIWPSLWLTDYLPLRTKWAAATKYWEKLVYPYSAREKIEEEESRREKARLLAQIAQNKTKMKATMAQNVAPMPNKEKKKMEKDLFKKVTKQKDANVAPMPNKEKEKMEKDLFKKYTKQKDAATGQSYSRGYLGLMYLASKLAERGIEVRVIEGFQDSSDDYDLHVGCQTVVWLIAALIRSNTFTSNPALSVSLIDSYSPDNRDGKMITALSKFASFVYSRGIEFGERCAPILESGGTGGAATQKIADIAKEYEGTVTDYAASLFEIKGVEEVSKEGYAMKWQIGLKSY